MIARMRLLAMIAGVCCAAIGCSSSNYAGMKYYGSCGCGPGRWAPHGVAGHLSPGYFDSCGGGQCGGTSQCGSGVNCGDECGCNRGETVCGRVLNELCGCSACCGKFYWSEWYDSPPGCEPCDSCGNYTGCNGRGSGACSSPNCSSGCARAAPIRLGPAVSSADRQEMSEREEIIDVADFEEAPEQEAAFDAYQAEFDEVEDEALQ